MKSFFKYCPECKNTNLEFAGDKRFRCMNCGWEYYHNTASATTGFIEKEDKVLVIERNREPGKGMLAFPGGFVDPGESLEEAFVREISEELFVKVTNLKYLCSASNKYHYKGIEYSTCDTFFTAEINEDIQKVDDVEVAGFRWVSKDELKPEAFAFDSMRRAIEVYLKRG